MQTERLTIMIEPNYKAAVAKQAAARGVSTSEHVRNALDSFESNDADAELAALTAELEEALPAMREDCDAIIASMKAMNDKMDAYRAEKRMRNAA